MGSQNWETPGEFIRAVQSLIGAEFGLDACAVEANKKAARFIGPEVDALRDGVEWTYYGTSAWPHRWIWCNPGFGDMAPWLEKAWETRQLSSVVVMGLVAPSTDWWGEWGLKASEIIELSPRVQFLPPPGEAKSSNPRENCLFVYNAWSGLRPAARWRWTWKQ